MSTDASTVHWHDLRTKGFVHVKGFLSALELKYLRDGYAATHGADGANGNYPVFDVPWKLVWRLESKLRSTTAQVRDATGLNADMSVGAQYFSIEKGINFGWHQDHESYFVFQQHRDYLNFYMPIIKGDPEHSNLCILPFDSLRARAPQQFSRIEGRGAQVFLPGSPGSPTFVTDDENGIEYALPVDIEELKATPRLEAGDLLLLRGDMVHRTQDTETDRVSVSFRRTSSTAMISKQRLLSGGPKKKRMIENNHAAYEDVLRCFADLDTEHLTARQLQDYLFERILKAGTPSSARNETAIA
jgi:hypothetical protein